MSRRAWLWGVALMAAATACSLDLVDPSDAPRAAHFYVRLNADSAGAWNVSGGFRPGVDETGVERGITDPTLSVGGTVLLPDSTFDEQGLLLRWRAPLAVSAPLPDLVEVVGPRLADDWPPQRFLLPVRRVVQAPPSVWRGSGDVIILLSEEAAGAAEPSREDWWIEIREWSEGKAAGSVASVHSTAPLPDSLRVSADWLLAEGVDTLQVNLSYHRAFEAARSDSTATALVQVFGDFVWLMHVQRPPASRGVGDPRIASDF